MKPKYVLVSNIGLNGFSFKNILLFICSHNINLDYSFHFGRNLLVAFGNTFLLYLRIKY